MLAVKNNNNSNKPARLPSMTAEVQNPSLVDQILKPSAKPTYNFAFTDFLKREFKFGLDTGRPTCKAFQQGHCPLGDRCPDKHLHQSNYNK